MVKTVTSLLLAKAKHRGDFGCAKGTQDVTQVTKQWEIDSLP